MQDFSYNLFHKSATVQSKIISDNNFTYYSVVQKLKKIINNRKGLDILDYGCGVGTISLYLASKGNKVTGIDVSDKAIELCTKNAMATSMTDTTNFLTTSKWEKQQKKRKFDLIICIEVIEHVQNDKELLVSLVKRLKHSGTIFITTPSIEAPLYKLGLLNKFDYKVGHLRRYNAKELVENLKRVGIKHLEFEIKESPLRNLLYTFDFLGLFIKFLKGPLSVFFMHLDNLLVMIFGGSNIYLVGVKK